MKNLLTMILLCQSLISYGQIQRWIQDNDMERVWYDEIRLRQFQGKVFESYPVSWQQHHFSTDIPSFIPYNSWKNWSQDFLFSFDTDDTVIIRLFSHGEAKTRQHYRELKDYRLTNRTGVDIRIEKHILFSSALQLDTDAGMDPDYKGRSGNQINNQEVNGYLFHRYAYIKGEFQWLEWMVGKQKISFGPSITHSLILSEHAPPMDLLWFRFNMNAIRITAFYGFLDHSTYISPKLPTNEMEIYRHLAGHRFELAVTKNLNMGATQTILIPSASNSIQVKYFNPMITYFGERENEGLSVLDDNIGYGMDITWRQSGLKSYSEIFLDDYSLDGTVVNKIGLSVGFQLSDPILPIPLTISSEFTRISPKTYTVKTENGPVWLDYVMYPKLLPNHLKDLNQPSILGNPLGPDSWQWFFDVKYWGFYPFWLNVSLTVLNKGSENNLSGQAILPGLDYSEKRLKFATSLTYDWVGWGYLSCFVHYDDYGKIAMTNTSRSDVFFGLKGSLNIQWQTPIANTIF